MEHQASSKGPAPAKSELRIPATAVSRGIGIGRVVFLNGNRAASDEIHLTPSKTGHEIDRLRAAVSLSIVELTELTTQNTADSLESASGIFGVHLLIIENSSLVPNIESEIRDRNVNAEWAVRKVAEAFAERQKAVPDQHLSDKYLDVVDVAERILRALGVGSMHEEIETGSVFVVTEMMPSRLMELAKRSPVAVISEHGGWTSHSSILARELKLPVVTGVKLIEQFISNGDTVIVDGVEGQIIVRPTAGTMTHFLTVADSQVLFANLPAADDRPLTTLDGHEITIRANADLPHVYEIAARSGATGVGLYRSEVILSQFRGFPSESEQTAVYSRIAEAAGEDGVRIRTFDISVEQFDGSASRERNPSLGLRSIRLSLTDSAHFRTQIRAILRAAYQQNVDIVLPMISGVFEVIQLREIIEQEGSNLRNEGVPIGAPKIGAMIEVPSAVFTANEIARHVDFLCLGTNDLVQYLLAVDRDNETVADWYQTLHPAVIRAIKEVIAAGYKAGKSVTICGETAGSAFYVPLLIGLGARELSMNVNSISQIRRLIAGVSVSEAGRLVESIETLETADEIEETLRTHYLREWEHLFPPGLLSSKYPQ